MGAYLVFALVKYGGENGIHIVPERKTDYADEFNPNRELGGLTGFRYNIRFRFRPPTFESTEKQNMSPNSHKELGAGGIFERFEE